MKKIFLDFGNFNVGDCISIDGKDYHHLARVLRVKKGESFVIGSSNGDEFFGTVVLVDNKKVTIEIGKEIPQNKIKIPEISLFFSVLKGDKNDYLIQKCTEIGVDKFIPVVTKNTIVKLDSNKDKKKIRWGNIAKEASMQSCRRSIPSISDFMMFDDLKKYDNKCRKFFCYVLEKSEKINTSLDRDDSILPVSFFIGPEGGFDKSEADALSEAGWQSVSLSDNVLRSETAAVVASSVIVNHYWSKK